MNNNIWVENIDCIKFLKKLPDKSIDLILTDPPFGINEKQFDNIHYSRNQKLVIDGYNIDEVMREIYSNLFYFYRKKLKGIIIPEKKGEK